MICLPSISHYRESRPIRRWDYLNDVINEVFRAGVNKLMRFVRPEDECIAGYDLCLTILMTDISLARNDQVKLPLCRVRVVRKIWFARSHAIPFQIERMPLGQIERIRIASQRFRNSFEAHGVFSTWRLPCCFFDVVNVYLAHMVL